MSESKRGKYRRTSDTRLTETGKRLWITVTSIVLIVLIALAVGLSRTVI